MKHQFVCECCGNVVEYNILKPTASIKCEHCEKEFTISKNIVAVALELVTLFLVAMGVRQILETMDLQLNIIFEFMLVLVVLLAINVCFEVFFTRIIKWPGYIHLIERKTK